MIVYTLNKKKQFYFFKNEIYQGSCMRSSLFKILNEWSKLKLNDI